MSEAFTKHGSNTFELGEQESVKVEPEVVAVLPATPSNSTPLSTKTLLADLRARLREVKKQIAERKRLERERDQIMRLLKAAKKNKTPTVHALKRVAG